MKNLGKKILAVMKEVESVEKDGFNAFHKYKYTSDVAIVTAIRKSLIKNGLVIIPNQKLVTQSGDVTCLTVEYTMTDVDSGESITASVVGYGQDKGDKGPYKAATGAEKYFLLKTFLIPTDDDPENENKSSKSNGKHYGSFDPDKEPSAMKTITTQVSEVKAFVARNENKTPYFKIIAAEGDSYTTFDKKIAEDAKKTIGSGKSVIIEFKTDHYGNTVEGFEAMP